MTTESLSGIDIEIIVADGLHTAGWHVESEERLREAVMRTLREACTSGPASLSVVITTNEGIQELNRQYRGYDLPTDVLAFAAADPMGSSFVLPAEAGPLYLGDIMISWPRAQQQATERGHASQVELCLLAIHGTLHLLGYDHTSPSEKASMWEMQTRVMLGMFGEEGLSAARSDE